MSFPNAPQARKEVNNMTAIASELDLHVEMLESLDAPFDWSDFWSGVGVGVAIGIAIT